MEKFVEQINNKIVELSFNEDFEVQNADMQPPEEINIDFIKENDFNQIYSNFNGAELLWTNIKLKTNGSFKLQSLDNFYTDGWEDMVDEIEGKIDCELNSFRVFDFFSNQEYVGCFLNNYNDVGLFYVRETTAYPLNISATSYLKLLEQCLGISHWPSLLVKCNLDIELTESRDIEKNIRDTFNRLSIENFKNQYLSLRI